MSSRKKRDTMIAFRGTAATDDGVGPSILTNGLLGQPYMFAWVATARDLDLGTGTPALSNINDDASRTATRTFWRGVKENVVLNTNSGHGWKWRRICFTYKSDSLMLLEESRSWLNLWRETTSNGFVRFTAKVLGLGTDASSEVVGQNIINVLFKGVGGVDWRSLINAPTDKDRVTIKYDKIRLVQGGNESAHARTHKIWHGMNKTLIYDDDEDGGGKNASYLSSPSNKSMGDYYIIDIIEPNIGGVEGDTLYFEPQATAYWHER